MSGGLIIRLRPHERFLINGVLLENGDKRAKLRVKSRDVCVLRLRDALHPDAATTPVKRLYYATQLVVTGDTKPDVATPALTLGLQRLRAAFPAEDQRAKIDQAIVHAKKGEFYRVLRLLKTLIPDEGKILAMAPPKIFSTATVETR